MTYIIHYRRATNPGYDHVVRSTRFADTPGDGWFLAAACRSHDRNAIRITRIERINPC